MKRHSATNSCLRMASVPTTFLAIGAACVGAIHLTTVPNLRAAPLVTQQAYVKASNTQGGDSFGTAVAVSGDTSVIGAVGAGGSGAAYVFVRQGNVWVQQAFLKSSNAEPGDAFGYNLALWGDTLVVAALLEDSGARGVNGDPGDNTGTNSGAVYVFERTGNNWVQQAYLKPSNTEFGESFGRSVSIHGDTIVVGANTESSGARGVNGDQFNNDVPAAGAAYVFVRSGTNWTQQAYLKASNPGVNDFFGYRVAVWGDTIAASAILEDSGAAGVDGNQSDNSVRASGAVYVFTRSGTNWAQQAYLKASNPGSTNQAGFIFGDEFGFSVSLCGETLVVGARGESSNAAGVNGDQGDNSALNAGAAYVFARTGSTWTQEAYLKSSNPRAFDEFGFSVAAMTEVRLLVSSPGENSSATGVDGNQINFDAVGSGAAYLFTRSGGNWIQTSYIKASNTGASDRFGWSVAGFGETLLIGAPREDGSATGIDGNQADNSADSAGAAYVFTAVTPGSPSILNQPLSRTNNATTKATFLVAATGTPPLHYQWRRNGLNLTDGPNVFGAQGSLLNLFQTFGADGGSYDVVVSNASGSVTSLVALLTVLDPVILRRSPTPWPTVADSFSLSIEAAGTPPLTYGWKHNGTDIPGAAGPTLTIPHAQASETGEYRVVVANAFGATSTTFQVSVNASRADSFSPELTIEGPPGAVPWGAGLAVHTDGRIVVAGLFSAVDGIPSPSLARLHPDGSGDPSLRSGLPDPPNPYSSLVVGPDQGILTSGDFVGPPFFARYLQNGQMDPAFALPPDQIISGSSPLVQQPSGNVLFTMLSGPFALLRRLDADGNFDEMFGYDVFQVVSAVAVQADGKVLIGGALDGIEAPNESHPVTGLGRLNADGSVDDSFVPRVLDEGGEVRGWVETIAVQEDGRILVTGAFGEINGHPCHGIGRLNPDGSVDPTFNVTFASAWGAYVRSVALQADGRIILAGEFESINGQPVRQIARLHPDGSLDLTFRPAVDGPVQAVAIQPDGRVLVGGFFTMLGGQPRTGLGRLLNTGPATASLTYDGFNLTWLRGGTSPAVWATIFEHSADGTNWTALGAGTRISGGWQLPGVVVPGGTKLRARGWVAGGSANASTWIVESVITVPLQILSATVRKQPFGFQVLGGAGQSVVIERSTDLRNWSPIQTNAVPGNGQIEFIDASASQILHRFYRARIKE